MLRLQCSKVWGGIKNENLDVCSPGLNVSLYSSSCNGGRGGDVYYFSMCSANSVTRIALADVVGHGEAVSQIGQWVYEQVAARLDESDLSGMMANLNERIVRKGFNALTTAVVLSYSRDLKRVYCCNAGHPPMLIRSHDGEWNELVPPRSETLENLPLGVTNDARYVMSDAHLTDGEVLLIYSDGVLEAPNRDGVLFGFLRLRAALREIGSADASELKHGVISRLRDWTGGSLDHDDVTLIAIQLDEHGRSPGRASPKEYRRVAARVLRHCDERSWFATGSSASRIRNGNDKPLDHGTRSFVCGDCSGDLRGMPVRWARSP